jgi:hypothetical protein
MVGSGFFWTSDVDASGSDRILIGATPGELVQRRHQPTFLNADFIRAALLGGSDPRSTPYRGIYRIQSGRIATWTSLQEMPQETSLPQFVFDQKPFRDGPQAMEAYLDAFDHALDNAMEGTAPLAATLSGGLDSSFVVASLALKTTPDRPVHAFSHRPHPDAGLRSRSKWDPDDSEFALLLEKQYPGRVIVTRVFNDEMIQPLDAARAAAMRSWWPTFNPGNQIWMDEFQRRGRELGAAGLFIGQKGNASFSSEPAYAAPYYLSQGRIDQIFALAYAGKDAGMSVRESLRSRVLAPLKGQLVGDSRQPTLAQSLLSDAESARLPPRRHFFGGRRAFLTWLDPSTAAHMGATHGPGQILPTLDPFSAASVIRVASEITPLEWSQGQFPRGFARRAGIGRVPDEIRSRTRRGGQSWDIWFVMRQQKDRYFDEIALLSDTPVVGEVIDPEAVKSLANSWNWSEDASPEFLELTQMNTILSLADFVRLTVARLASLETRQ